jgi:Nucleotide-diphospho-sugar transferase
MITSGRVEQNVLKASVAIIFIWLLFLTASSSSQKQISSLSDHNSVPSQCPVAVPSQCPPLEMVERVVCPSPEPSPSAQVKNNFPSFTSGVFSSYTEAGEAVGIPMRWGNKLVVLTSGNQAISPFMMNLQRSIARLNMPFPLLHVPLDNNLFNEFATRAREAFSSSTLSAPTDSNLTTYSYSASTSFHVLDMPDIRARFSPLESTFRQGQYNQMALTKWELAEGFQLAGYDVLVIDPDIVLLRSPIGFFETLPLCDSYFHLDTNQEFDENSFRQYGGYAKSDESVTNFFNTGFMLLRSTGRAITLVKDSLKFARDYYNVNPDELHVDDQNVFDHWIQDYYGYNALGLSDGDYASSRTLSNQCFEYSKRPTKEMNPIPGAAVEFSIYPLTPAIFPNRPIYQEVAQHKRVNMLPFMMHANWLVGLANKRAWLESYGRWYPN